MPTSPTLAARFRSSGAIELRHLTFTYPGSDRPVLDDVSLRIEPGQTVAFVGATGSRQVHADFACCRACTSRRQARSSWTASTCAKYRWNACAAPSGSCRRSHFCSRSTIAENIAFGVRPQKNTEKHRPQKNTEKHSIEKDTEKHSMDPDLERRMKDAAAVARLDKDVESFPNGYQTAVGERGITLSGGQKQRTALARALMVDPRVLILDDALSAVDTYTEEEILSRLKGVMRQRTSIIVAHRVSTVRDADQIFVLDRGRIAERGHHDALVARGGLYAALYKRQLWKRSWRQAELARGASSQLAS